MQENINEVKLYLLNLQKNICTALEHFETKNKFINDEWQREKGSEGISRILENGDTIEKGGVNFSHIHGKQLPPSATIKHPKLAGRNFQAMGISLVIHPCNPYAPTTHMNIRLFIAEKENTDPIWWFGGGYDLTPYYGFDEDCIHWHKTAKRACDPFAKDIYPEFKKACDNYFFLKNRNEARGIGGLFFDDLTRWDFTTCLKFIRSIGNSFIDAYQPIIEKRKDIPYGDRERDFQCYRRGRYVEFNLVYDRGTLFGLQSHGRTESILMSMPPEVKWRYNWQPKAGTPEAELYEYYLKPRDWA